MSELLVLRFSSYFARIQYDDTGHRDGTLVGEIRRQRCTGIPTLAELCAKKSFRHENLMARYRELPQGCLDILAHIALNMEDEQGMVPLSFILPSWKENVFHVAYRDEFRSYKSFSMEKLDILRRLRFELDEMPIRCMIFAIRTMLDYAREPSVDELVIDLSEVLFSQRLIYLIFSEILTQLRTDYRSRLVSLKVKRRKLCSQSSGAGRKIHLKLTCIFPSAVTISRLCGAVYSSRSVFSPVQLTVSGVVIKPTALSWDSLNDLSLLDSKSVEVLNCTCCKNPVILAKVFNLVSSFENLRTLDLTSSGIGVFDHLLLLILSKTLMDLHHLRQLHLSKCKITGFLQLLIGKIHQDRAKGDERGKVYTGKLEHLALCDCDLGVSDFKYLSRSHHAKTLKNLDISWNKLEIESLECLLRACSELVVLEMDNCILHLEYLYRDRMYPIFSRMKNLRFLDIFNSCHISAVSAMAKASFFAQMTNLEVLKITASYPDDGTFVRHGEDFVQYDPVSISSMLTAAIKENQAVPNDDLGIFTS